MINNQIVEIVSFANSYSTLPNTWRLFTLQIGEDMHKSSEVVRVDNPYATCMENPCSLRAGFACYNNKQRL